MRNENDEVKIAIQYPHHLLRYDLIASNISSEFNKNIYIV